MTAPTQAPAAHSIDLRDDVLPSNVQRGSSTSAPIEEHHTGLDAHRATTAALIALRLALGFDFLWAFVDKVFGLGYSTPSANAWIHGGSPTKGFLGHVAVGPFQSTFHSIAGAPWADWLFMLGLLGIGAAFMLGVALRPAAICGVVLLVMMWFATWPFAKFAAGQPSGSTNPFVDEHILTALAMIVVALLVTTSSGFLGRKWAQLGPVAKNAWLR